MDGQSMWAMSIGVQRRKSSRLTFNHVGPSTVLRSCVTSGPVIPRDTPMLNSPILRLSPMPWSSTNHCSVHDLSRSHPNAPMCQGWLLVGADGAVVLVEDSVVGGLVDIHLRMAHHHMEEASVVAGK